MVQKDWNAHLASIVHVLDDDPIDYVLPVKAQREVKRQTALAYSSITIHDTAPMYFTSSFVNNIPLCWSSAHIWESCCCHKDPTQDG